jgi:threonine synthase
MSYFTHLECSVPCGAGPFDPRERHHLCTCGAPLLARYDLAAASSWKKETLAGREPTTWRYREMLPLLPGDEPVTLGEGFTPLFHARALGRELGLDALYIKDESLNPTNSFKARGQAAAITRAKALGAHTISVPSAGNAGNAMAAYAARAGLKAQVFLPRDAKEPFVLECRQYGAEVTLVDGLITDAGRVALERGKPLGWYDVSTLKEPYRVEGKKTMAYELAEQLGWRWPDWIVYPTGGGTGLIGMWKAFEEIETIGWVPRGRRPKMVSVQAEGCAPIIRAFEQGKEKADPWEHAATVADGLRVPRAIADFLILRAVRESGGTAVAVSDADMVRDMVEVGRLEGVSAAPEGGAALTAIRRLVNDGSIRRHETVVLFNTGGALKYLDVLRQSPKETPSERAVSSRS